MSHESVDVGVSESNPVKSVRLSGLYGNSIPSFTHGPLLGVFTPLLHVYGVSVIGDTFIKKFKKESCNISFLY